MDELRQQFIAYLMGWLDTYTPQNADLVYALVVLFWIAFVSIAIHLILHRVVLKWVRSQAASGRHLWQKALFEHKTFSRLALTLQGGIIQIQARLWLDSQSALLKAIETAMLLWMILFATSAFFALLNTVRDIFQKTQAIRHLPIHGLIQSVKLISGILICILAISMLADKSPLLLLSGLGAISAVIMLIFKDPILGLMAGIQLSVNNMLAVNDWLEMPKYGADGDIIEIGLTTVKVRNWDKTITTIPTYALISDSFKNWRGMSESGGRRIKRILLLEISSVRFLDEEDLQRLYKAKLLSAYLNEKIEEIDRYNNDADMDLSSLVNGRRLTNLGTLRAYMTAYLKAHPHIHQDMTLMVRQLAPGADGLPMEVYAFTNTTAWIEYERIQADIFDHFFAILPEFDLRAHEAPTGHDIRLLGSNSGTESEAGTASTA